MSGGARVRRALGILAGRSTWRWAERFAWVALLAFLNEVSGLFASVALEQAIGRLLREPAHSSAPRAAR